MTALTSIRNIGPRMAKNFQNAGIFNADTVREIGLDAAYARLLQAGMRPHFMAYWALAAGLENRWFSTYQDDEKARLRVRHDAIVAANKNDKKGPDPEVEAIMNTLGIID